MGFGQTAHDLKKYMTYECRTLAAWRKNLKSQALKELHDQIEHVLIRTEVEKSDRVRMSQLGGGLGFVPEPVNGFLGID